MLVFLGWDHFVSVKIEKWEEFHLKWLQEGNDILIIVFESLPRGSLNETLKDISAFLNFEFDENRLECTARHSEGRFHRKERCIRHESPVSNKKVEANDTILLSPDMAIRLALLSLDPHDIFTEHQKNKVNLAIRNVNNAILERGLKPLPVSDYENTVIGLNLCP